MLGRAGHSPTGIFLNGDSTQNGIVVIAAGNHGGSPVGTDLGRPEDWPAAIELSGLSGIVRLTTNGTTRVTVQDAVTTIRDRLEFTTSGQGLILQEGAALAGAAITSGHAALWLRNDTPNTLIFKDDAGTDYVIGGAAFKPGKWAQISNTNISGSPTQFIVEWDEAVYSDIKIIISGIQCADDGITLSMRLGDTNGTNFYATTGDYDGHTDSYDTPAAPVQITPTDRIPLITSTGNVSGEIINGTILIWGSHGSNVGAAVNAKLYYKNSAGNTRAFEVRAFTDDAVGGAAIDSVRFVFNATTDRTWANVGNITVYGLTR